ncbi:DNA primase [Namhaeicola litoreus]|uniref:DNA primase n=1 Tax=Namhaeicola litoreus TaxID=1052145 RepID=A0ABW3XZD1_9FLAO
MISRNTIDKVFEIARVEEVIGDFVNLKKSGSNYKGLSPFVDEKTPSFMVSPVKQIWKDFSSGKGGNAVTFLMEHEHYTYPEAIRFLAKKYQIEIEETVQTDEQKAQADERESMYLLSEFAKNYFHKNLLETQKGKAIGLSYFRERGFTAETIKKYELGYSLDEWSAFTDYALEKKYKLDFLQKTGLTIVNEQKQFDRFKGRVMFPIHSMSGRVLGFGGRTLLKDAKVAKYVNSPESDIYHKSKVLYGLYQAKQSIAQKDLCFLVEGYTDVISLHQAGIHNVVASSGTALTPDQIRLIKRLTPNVTVLFDGDAAGIRASLRGIDLILEQGLNVKVVTFPNGEDPDSFAKQRETEEIIVFLEENAKDFIRFKTSLLLEEAQNDPIKKAGLIRDIVQSIAKIPDNIQREVYVQECSHLLDISEAVLFSELAQILKRNQQNPSDVQSLQPAFTGVKVEKKKQPKIDQLYLLEKKIIEILLLFGNETVDFVDYELDPENGSKPKKIVIQNKVSYEIYTQLQDDEIEFTDDVFKKIYFEIIHQLNQNKEVSSDFFTQHEDLNLGSAVSDILMEDEKHVLSDWGRKDIQVKPKERNLNKLVLDVIYNLRRILIEQKIQSIGEELKTVEIENEEIDLRMEKLDTIMEYNNLKKLLFEKLNRVI